MSSRDWWKLLKSVNNTSRKSSIPPLISDDMIIDDDHDKANFLNLYFKHQSQINDTLDSPPPLPNPNHFLDLPTFEPSDVENILKFLPTRKASGLDEVSNTVLRELSHELSFPLCEPFTKSLFSCIAPAIWKDAHVCAILKKGDPALVSNYRPVSLLSNISKIFERLIFKHVFNCLSNINFLHLFSQVSCHAIQQRINWLLSIILLVGLWMKERKCEQCFSILARLLIGYGTLDC